MKQWWTTRDTTPFPKRYPHFRRLQDVQPIQSILLTASLPSHTFLDRMRAHRVITHQAIFHRCQIRCLPSLLVVSAKVTLYVYAAKLLALVPWNNLWILTNSTQMLKRK